MTAHVLLIGAFDRFNFGDLLFPTVIRRTLTDLGVKAEYSTLSLVDADLSSRGGVATGALSALAERPPPPETRAIVAGGEVLAARWLDAHLGLTSPARALALKVLARSMGSNSVDRISRHVLGAARAMPWVLTPEDIGPDARVAYAAVGGSGLDRLPESLRADVRRRLGQAAHLSVRDHQTASTLRGWGVAHAEAPDSAALVARLFPRRDALRRCSPEVSAAAARLTPYILVQAGRYPTWGETRPLAQALRRLHESTGLGLLFVPLGQASGHDDRRALTCVARRLTDVPLALLERPDVVDIFACIAAARLVVGTSLHANLVALTYAVPRVGFGRRVAKLDAFLRTWDPLQPNGCCPVNEITERARHALDSDPRELEEISDSVADAARANLCRLAEDLWR